jgi:hypothetical protein
MEVGIVKPAGFHYAVMGIAYNLAMEAGLQIVIVYVNIGIICNGQFIYRTKIIPDGGTAPCQRVRVFV